MPDLDAVRRVNALGSLLGQPGDPVMCKVLPGISVHWYPTAAPAGTPCMCGQRRKDADEIEEDLDA
jgi:hypothetical protein